jgi:uncharacterized spore protein YtfJ
VAATQAEATEEARRAAEGGLAEQFVERLVERIGGRASVTAVFGAPTERGGVTVIPVARVRWGFGGGAGEGGEPKGPTGYGSGGGGGVSADPVGFVEIGPDGAVFRPITQPYPSPLFLLLSGIAAAIVLRAMARLIRG